MEIRRLTGFTWEQLAQLFNVSRRTLHFWASGQKLNSFNEQQLYLLLDTIRYIDRGGASLNRSILLNPIENETRPFDLLIAGKYRKVKDILGSINLPKKPELKPLSEEAERLRRPLDPETLVSADPSYPC
jgi:transcriptional regulator with XRE-family HTH domain